MEFLGDFELVQLALNGNQHAYTELMRRYKKTVFFVILKLVNNNSGTADDLMMETFAKAFNRLSKYDPKKGAFGTWLGRIAINHAIDYTRKKKLQIFSIDSSVEGAEGNSFVPSYPSEELDPEEIVIKNQRREAIHGLSQKLTPKYLELINLRFFQELSYLEIAEKLDIPLGTVKARLSRAKVLLRDMLGNEEGEVDD